MDQSEITRLSGNLSLVEQNIRIFSQIISETSIPGTESAQDATLLSQLDKACREMQSRLTSLLSELDPAAAGDLFMDALRINDDLNNIFLRYERFCRSRPQNKNPSNSPSPPAYSEQPAGPVATGMLIDIGDSSQPQPPTPTTPNNGTEAEYWLNSGRNEQNQGNSEFDQFLAHTKK